MLNIRSLLVCAGIFITAVSFSQGPGAGFNQNLPAEGVITGLIFDKSLNTPMEYANIVLFSVKDSSMVSGAVTNPAGKFLLEKVPFGRFYVIANFIGYNKTTISDIRINPQQKTVDLGTILLEPASTYLNNVEVVAEKTRVEYKIDKKIVNVSQDLMGTGSNAVAVLENVPSVQVDIEGNVSLRGSSNFTVLIDGRPSVLQGSDALQQIPASIIERIEIITNPSARYDPDGVGGIINVIQKKQKEPGVNGVVNVSAGSGNKYKTDGLLNYRHARYNLFGGFDFNYHEFTMDGKSENRYYYTDSTQFRYTDIDGDMNRKGYGLKAGFDYFLTSKSTLTAFGRIGGYSFGRDAKSSRHTYTIPSLSDEFSKSVTTSDREGTFYEGNVSYINKLNENGHQIEASVFYSTRNGDDAEEQQDFLTDSGWNINDNTPESIRTTEKETSGNIRVKADYVRPFSKEGKFEAGVQSRIELENEKFTFLDFDYPGSQWIENSKYTSEADFTENIQAVYTTLSNVWKKFGYQLGLRGEYTYRNIDNLKADQPYTIDRFDYFPTVHVSFQLPKDYQLIASYGRRIERPDGRELDPFPSYMDSYNMRIGNPGLSPEFIDSWELSGQKKFKASFISLDGYYRITDNLISQFTTLQSDGTFLHTFRNMNKDIALGSELMANLELKKWFQVNASLNIYDYRLKGTLEGEDVDRHSTNWSGRLNTTFKMKYDFRVQLSGIYSGPSVTAQGRTEDFFVSNIAVRKDFLKKKLSATLSVRDMFKTAKREWTSTGTGFYSTSKHQREAPVIMLDLSYLINNYKKQRETNGKQDNGSDMEIDLY